MTINKNLRDLRQISGMTQEEVASRVGLTRQAISSYESGRTEPDLDMLVRLAGLYQADISDILYGSSHAQRKLHTVRGIAAAVFAAVLLLLFFASALLLFMNTCLPVPMGVPAPVTDPSMEQLIKTRFALHDVRNVLLGISQAVSKVGCLILAVLLAGLKNLPSLKKCLLTALVYVLCAAACTIPFGAFDPIYRYADYVLALLCIVPPALLLLLWRVVLGLLKNRRANAEETRPQK